MSAKNKRLLGSLMALALMATALAGCGGGQGENPKESAKVSAPVAAAPAPQAPADTRAPAADPNTPVSSPATGNPAPVQQAPAGAPQQPSAGGTGTSSGSSGSPTAPAPPAAPTNPATPVTTPPAQEKPVAQVEVLSYATLQKGTYSGVTERMAVVVTDEQAWQKLWQQHASRAVPAPPAPAVDFSKESVLVVYMGEKNSGGYSIEVTGVQKENGKLAVSVRQTSPGPGTMTTMALTQPFHMVRIPKVQAGTNVNVKW